MTNRIMAWTGWARRWWLGAAVAGAGLTAAMPAAQAASPSICADTDVLQFIADKYLRPEINATLVRDSVAEFPTADQAQVLCAMYVRREIFDASRYGQWPRIDFEPQSFLVKKLSVGFEVSRPR